MAFKSKNILIHIPNKEKTFHEKWYKGRNPLNFPHPFRCLLCGGVNSGKTNIIKNIALRAKPRFEKIYLLHCGGSFTTEYDDIDFLPLNELPQPNSDDFDGKCKTLIIIEDKEYEYMSKDQKKCLDRLFGYMSTHKNISICCTSQTFFNTPPAVRNMSNIYILWKVCDSDTVKCIARRVNIDKNDFLYLMNSVLTEPRDSLWVDNTAGSPYKLRKNGYQMLDHT